MKYRSLFIILLLPLTILFPAGNVYSEEIKITVEGNGSESENEAKVESTSETKVEQSNEAEINNDVKVDVDTGNNTADDNTGDSSIETGDVKSEINIENEGINKNSSKDSGCNCDSSTNIEVSGNGSGSENDVYVETHTKSHNTQTNNAHIENSSETNANTGNNSANNNTGDVHIKTGSIYSETRIRNKHINKNSSKNFGGNSQDKGDSEINISVSGNGEGSHNSVAYDRVKHIIHNARNTANIVNSAKHNLNTGGNSADGNVGDVWIGTGDVVSVIDIVNRDINKNKFKKKKPGVGGEKPEKPEKPGDDVTPPPAKPPHHNGEDRDRDEDGDVGGADGDVLGAANGEVLPITGGLLQAWLTLFAIILFLAGWYLRFRSGGGPPVAAKS